MAKIYTRGGDEGNTSLGSGERVAKTHPRIQAAGDVDELCAILGLALAEATRASVPCCDSLKVIQCDLFALGSSLSAPGAAVPRVSAERVSWLEGEIDRIEQTLTPLKRFILPGGSLAGATLHLARCVARRAERGVCELAASEGTNRWALRYLNRLSDLLFVMAREANNGEEIEWRPEEADGKS